jgi:hypothetical protein
LFRDVAAKNFLLVPVLMGLARQVWTFRSSAILQAESAKRNCDVEECCGMGILPM